MQSSRHIALVLCLAAGATRADAAIEMKFIGVGPGGGLVTPLRYNGVDLRAGVGQLHWKVQGDAEAPLLQAALLDSQIDGDAVDDNLIAFCIELGQAADTHWNRYEKGLVKDASKPPFSGIAIGDARAIALDRLADNFWSAATGGDLVNAVAFQLAVWEIVHETPSANDGNPLPSALDVGVNAGSFFVNKSAPTGLLLGAVTLANTWLSDLAGGLLPNVDPFGEYSLIALTNCYKQDQIVQLYTPRPPEAVTAAPEPSAVIVWTALALCSSTAWRLRRRSASRTGQA